MKISAINFLAKINDWKFLTFQEDISMLSFTKNDMRINVYVTKMTVATCLNHPKKGRTQLFRKNVTSEEMLEIFKNPRVHTNKGYRKT